MASQPTSLITILQNLVTSVNSLGELSKFLEVNSYTTVGDVDYQILPTDRVVNNNVVPTASHVWTMPPLSSVNPGQRLTLILGASFSHPFTIASSPPDSLWTPLTGNSLTLNQTELLNVWEFVADVVGGLWVRTNDAPFPLTPPQGRLTLQSGNPVPSTVTGATTVYYTPYIGRCVPVMVGPTGGGGPVMVDFYTGNGGVDLSQALSDTTKSPAATVASTPYDMFIWNDNGTLRCTRGPAWAGNNARSLLLNRTQSGYLVNSSDITNGPKTNFGIYVGTIFTDSGNTLDWNYGGYASGGDAVEVLVWNMYNRVDFSGFVGDNGASYTYSSSTFREARNSPGGNAAYFVAGMIEDGFVSTYDSDVSVPSSAGGTARADIGIGFNSLTPAKRAFLQNLSTTASLVGSNHVSLALQPLLGFNDLIALEASGDNASAITFDNFSENRLNFNWRA